MLSPRRKATRPDRDRSGITSVYSPATGVYGGVEVLEARAGLKVFRDEKCDETSGERVENTSTTKARVVGRGEETRSEREEREAAEQNS